MTENLRFWETFRQPPKEALSKITGGRIAGMTDIKPIWRIKAMTEEFGPCGIGWKYEVVKRWTEPGSSDQVFAFVDVNVLIKDGDKWSEPIPGNGGSMLIAKETKGMHSNDEAFKMATTDAISSALKMIGVGADIYSGAFDGSKYNAPKPKYKSLMTKKQSDQLIKLCTKEKLEPTEVARQYGITKKMLGARFETVFKVIKEHIESGELGYKFAIPEGEETDTGELL